MQLELWSSFCHPSALILYRAKGVLYKPRIGYEKLMPRGNFVMVCSSIKMLDKMVDLGVRKTCGFFEVVFNPQGAPPWKACSHTI